ncbi:MAG: GNAT family N-acetyltransferase [Verrucomicrobiota bacterium]|nr:GNAT family N-acetyltransferase [Verrucomicrobiota bacterium]
MAKYEKLEDQLELDSERLLNCLFEENPIPKAIVATLDGTTVGYAIYFFNFSTFLGKKGVYLEDLYLERAYRGTGVGNRLSI